MHFRNPQLTPPPPNPRQPPIHPLYLLMIHHEETWFNANRTATLTVTVTPTVIFCYRPEMKIYETLINI